MLKPKSFRPYFFIIIFLSVFSFSTKAFASTPVDTNITEDTTWNLAGSPYVVQKSINVVVGATLIIEPGVIVKLSQSNILWIDGKLLAEGASDNKIENVSEIC